MAKISYFVALTLEILGGCAIFSFVGFVLFLAWGA
jgi:hypothetical protein